MQSATPVTTFRGPIQPIAGDDLLPKRDTRPALDGTDFDDVLGAPFSEEAMSQMPLLEVGQPISIHVPTLSVFPVAIEVPRPAATSLGFDVQMSSASPAYLESLSDQPLTDPSQRVAQYATTQPEPLSIFTQERNALPATPQADAGSLPAAIEGVTSATASLAQLSNRKPLSVALLVKSLPDLPITVAQFEGPSGSSSERVEPTHSMGRADPGQVIENEMKTGRDIGLLAGHLTNSALIKAEAAIMISRSTVQETAFRLQAGPDPHLSPSEVMLKPVTAQVPNATAQTQSGGHIAPMETALEAFASNVAEAADATSKDQPPPLEENLNRSLPGEPPKKITPAERADIRPQPEFKPSFMPSADIGSLPLPHDLPPEEALVSIASAAPTSAASNAPLAGLPPAHPSPMRQASTVIARPSAEVPGQIELTLTPETLGKLHFDMRPEGGALAITLSAERPETLDLMRRHLPELMAELKQAGVQAGSFSFGSWSQGQPSAPAAPPARASAPLEPPLDVPTLLAAPITAPSSQALDLRL